ncbi:electron transfer flavoprotein [Mixta theicola]|uniref:Electron transfer flavoprotein n=1 Tax=Mixta theicola TaxID=1458355 RepID=A0A2K1Q7P7_9GAMM|nr:FAD-binding protein [Mixta theicola]PNS11051.1 electron transfer flavoprotein [Mixta theicola]GLR08396.1 electron transfer flavoprotein [Mixta theicola]
MKIVLVVLHSGDEQDFAAFLADNQLEALPRTLWRATAPFFLAEQLLAPLEVAFRADPAALILFPCSREGDELATRLAWRLNGSAVCRASGCSLTEKKVSKAAYGSALTAMLTYSALPLCLTPARTLAGYRGNVPEAVTEKAIVPQPLGHSLAPPQRLSRPEHPLQSAKYVLATGQGACGEIFTELARGLDAEPGYTRQRVMSGGCDEQRMLGVSGQTVAPKVCIIAGASGASAFMTGVSKSQFIVAVNTDPAAPVFAAADVGIVGDAQAVLEALAARRRASG